MKSNIFIPTKINVGFQNRNDTYTKKLAYVIYYDEKGKLRKESSWNSWRDEKIPNEEFENVPTSGFVLNKKVGDYDSGWNHRHAYVRIYDPRNFEFEIGIENLLYILENTNSIKGKGLEGEFVYGWDGKDLVLIPTVSPDYKEITEYNKVVHNNEYIKTKDLKIGATYLAKDNTEMIYLGKFDVWDKVYDNIYYGEIKNIGKQFWFAYYTKHYSDDSLILYLNHYKSITNKFIGIVNETCVENYAELFDKLEHNKQYSPIDDSKDVFIPYKFDEFTIKIKSHYWGNTFYNKNKEEIKVRFNESKGVYIKEERIKDNYRYSFSTKDFEINDIKQLFTEFQPVHIDKYLENGNYYERIY